VSIATGAVFNLPNVMQEGLPYDRFTVKGRLQDGTFRLSELLLDGSSTTIVGQGSIDLIAETADLTLLVAPLKTVDSVIARVPILGDWLGNSLVSIPVKVSGPLSKPRVTPLSASAVGDQLLGFLKRTVKLPVKVFDSLPR